MYRLALLILLLAAACAPQPAAPVQPTLEPGGAVNISSYSFADAGNYVLRQGETITLTWARAPDDAARVAFLLFPPGWLNDLSDTNYTLLGEDTDLSDGAAIEWAVPGGVGGELAAFAYRQDGSIQAYSFSQTVSSAA